MPIITTAAVGTVLGKRALSELGDRVRRSMPQGKADLEAREQLDDVLVENTQQVQVLTRKIEATDTVLAHLSPRVQEVAEVVWDLIDYLDRYVSQQFPNPEDQPREEDKENVARDTAKAYATAGSREKREIIWAAFNNSFNPKFYKEGLYKVLWSLVEKLEYPHFRVIKQLQDGTYPESAMLAHVEDYFFAHALVSMGLVSESEHTHQRRRFNVFPIAQRLIEFASPPAK